MASHCTGQTDLEHTYHFVILPGVNAAAATAVLTAIKVAGGKRDTREVHFVGQGAKTAPSTA